ERRCIIHSADQQWTENAPGAPGGQHCAIDRARVLGPEEVCGKGRHGPKTSAVAEADQGCGNKEQGKVPNQGSEREADNLDSEQGQEGVWTANKVRNPAPEKSARAIKNRDCDDKPGCHACRDEGEFLRER